MEPHLKIEYMPVADLVPYAGNAKKHPEWQVSQIADSIKQFGNCDPVAVWHNALEVIGARMGHSPQPGRWRA